jgi:ubiquinone/menaquinone biosynthesis C-methylase UbiE
MSDPSPRTARVARTYDRVAGVLDLLSAPMEWMGGAARRRRVLERARGRVLEIGVGTGKNLELYPPGVEVTGIDISPRMLARAREHAARVGSPAALHLADAERLPYADASFDTVTATCVFCSVPDPVRGLREAARVVRPGGEVLLLEHVRPRNPVLGRLFDLLTPLTRRFLGPEINRRTEANVAAAGLRIVSCRSEGIFREMVAVPAAAAGGFPPTPVGRAP